MSMLDAVSVRRSSSRPRLGGASRPTTTVRSGDDAPDGLSRMWAPRRLDYVNGAEGGHRAVPGCALCQVLAVDDATSLVLHSGRHAYVVLNRFPYNNGHLMVVPRRHVSDLGDLTDAEALEIFDLTRRATRVLSDALYAQGLNIGLNVGEAAGASIVDHLHQHIVPRWCGDTNFLPVLAQTKVLPQTLEETWTVLATGWV